MEPCSVRLDCRPPRGERMAVNTEPKLVWQAEGLEIDLWPLQGLWTEEQYLRLTDQTNRLIEFSDGYVELLPMPTRKHQAISRLLFLALLTFVQQRGGTVFYAPLRVRVAPERFREPDLVVLLDAARGMKDPTAGSAFAALRPQPCAGPALPPTRRCAGWLRGHRRTSG